MAIPLLTSATNAIILSWGWRRNVIAFTSGAASALALPPFSFFPVLFVTFPILILLIDGALPVPGKGKFGAMRPAAMTGWLFGFGYFLAGLWWIGSAFLVEAETFAWLIPFAVAAMPAGLALFWAAAAALARAFWPGGPARILVLAGAFSILEYLRANVLTGFPWNAPGYALAAHDITMQAASIVGLHGMTLFAFIVFSVPVLAFGPARDKGLAFGFAACAGALLAGITVFGLIRLAGADQAVHDNVMLRIVQPNIAQADKWKPELKSRHFNDLLALSDQRQSPGTGGIGDITHLIWPETALPFLLSNARGEMSALAALLPPQSHLITGAFRTEPVPSHPLGRKVYNSIYVIGDDGTIIDAYDKLHLVPFGEYLPFQSLFDAIGLAPLTRQIGGFSAGQNRQNLRIGAAPPALPLICYEVAFPDLDGSSPARPGWLLNLTNDAWFGITPGPYQHFHQARLRAVEQGLPLVRAANTGISGIVDAYGRVRKILGLDQRGIVQGRLPVSLASTPFSRYGSRIFILLVAISLIFALMCHRLMAPQHRK